MKKVFKAILLIYLNICLTSFKFVQTANTEMKPCENFHKYECSVENRDPNYEEISQKLDDQMNKQLLSHLATVIQEKPANLATFKDKIITYFEACNNKAPNYFGEYFVPFEQLLADKTYNFWPLLGRMQSYGFNNVILNHRITRNMDNTLNIHLSSADIAEDEPLDSDDPTLLNVLTYLGYQSKWAVQKWLNNSIKWQDIATKYTQLKYKAKLKINFKTINLQLYTRLHSYLQNLLEAEIDNLSVITIDVRYYKFLIYTNWSPEEQKQICEYLFIKFLYYLEQDDTEAFEPLACVKDLRNKFDLGMNYIYYEQFFKQNEIKYKTALFSMLQYIKIFMSDQFKANHLQLSGKQIEFLLNKLQAVKINIGNLPDNFNLTQINTFYQAIPKLSSSNYCKNYLLLLKQRFRESLAYMQNQTYSLGTDSTTATTPSLPFYVLNKNMVVIPFGSFQLPLFHYQQTSLQQLSVFGFIMAHELTHAVGMVGLRFDQQGTELLHPSDILENANFRASVNCMQDQEPTDCVHERIADFFAVRVVYHIYLEYYAKGGQEDWSKEFFENLAQLFCGNSRLQYIAHDSDPVRLNQIVKNFPPFARTFDCPADTAMNLKTKCRLY
ncbi:membrane metallo-endopeptidase-like 1 [Calliphora vicina]|uniref:membrane metallo-endopeptidase-like 1 n=1 Tax=Calliphora vicina TaxID=7373 RepID=UPI00325BE942